MHPNVAWIGQAAVVCSPLSTGQDHLDLGRQFQAQCQHICDAAVPNSQANSCKQILHVALMQTDCFSKVCTMQMEVLLLDQSRGADVLPDSLSPLCHIVLQPLCSFFVATVVMLICRRCLFESRPLQQQSVFCEDFIFVDKQELNMFVLPCYTL